MKATKQALSLTYEAFLDDAEVPNGLYCEGVRIGGSMKLEGIFFVRTYGATSSSRESLQDCLESWILISEALGKRGRL